MRVQRWRLRATAVAMAALTLSASCGNEGIDEVGPDDTKAPSTTAVESGAPSTTTAEPTTSMAGAAARMEVTVRDGAVVGGASRKRVTLGEPVAIVIDADVADEVHVHGYDHKAPVAPGAPAELVFTPDIPGVFEVELEERGLVLLRLEVA
jgi:hypothetical protein